MELTFSQIIALMAASLGVFGPGAQLVHVLRTKSTVGLSVSTFTLLNLSIMCSVLLSTQYATGPASYFAATSLILKLGVLFLISRIVTVILVSIVGSFSWLVHYGPDFFRELALTPAYSEFVAFAWGLLLAIAFLPQVVMSHKTRNTKALSQASLVMTSLATVLWMVFAATVQNYAMIGWCAVMLIALLDLIALKLGFFPAKPQYAGEQQKA